MNGKRALRRGSWSVQELERLKSLLPRRGVQDTAALLRRTPESVRRKAFALFRNQARRSAWTAEEDLELRHGYGAVEVRLLAVVLRRPLQQVLERIAVLRQSLRTGPWTRQELRLLKQLYGTRTDEDLEVCLSRPRIEIRRHAESMCLQKDKRFRKARMAECMRMPRWTGEEVERLVVLYPVHPNLEVARQLGRSVAAVANKANQLGLRKSSDLLADIGRSNIAVRYSR